MKTHEHRPQQLNKQPASAGTLGEKGRCRSFCFCLMSSDAKSILGTMPLPAQHTAFNTLDFFFFFFVNTNDLFDANSWSLGQYETNNTHKKMWLHKKERLLRTVLPNVYRIPSRFSIKIWGWPTTSAVEGSFRTSSKPIISSRPVSVSRRMLELGKQGSLCIFWAKCCSICRRMGAWIPWVFLSITMSIFCWWASQFFSENSRGCADTRPCAACVLFHPCSMTFGTP